MVDNIIERLDTIQPRSNKGGEMAGPEFDSAEPEEVLMDLDEAFDIAFYEWLQTEEAAAFMLWLDSPFTDESDNSEAPVEPATDPDEEPQRIQDDEADMIPDKGIGVAQAAGLTLIVAAETIYQLDPESFDTEDSVHELTDAIDVVLVMMDEGLYVDALAILGNDILVRTDGCIDFGEPDENDWITTYEGQVLVYPLVLEAIELLEGLIE